MFKHTLYHLRIVPSYLYVRWSRENTLKLFFDTRRASRAAKIGIICKLQSNLHALGLPETKPETQHRRYRVRGSRCHRVGGTHCALRSQVPYFTYIIPPAMTLTLPVLCSQTQTSASGANPRFSSRLSTWRPRRCAHIVRTGYCRAQVIVGGIHP